MQHVSACQCISLHVSACQCAKAWHRMALALSLQVDHEDSAVAKFMDRLVMACDGLRLPRNHGTWMHMAHLTDEI